MAQLNAYLGFNGRCREAMTFYHGILGGTLHLQALGETPFGQSPNARKDDILHSTLVNNGWVLMGTDMTGPEGFTPGNNFAVAVGCSSEAEINELYTKMAADGGYVIDPLKEQFWNALFGAVTDKFGIRWMFNYDKSQQPAQQ